MAVTTVDLEAPVAGGFPGDERPHPNADLAGHSGHRRNVVDLSTMATGLTTEPDTVDTPVGYGSGGPQYRRPGE